jgi:hypothetical protein
MKKKILTLGLFLMITGLANAGNFAEMESYECLNYKTTCGTTGLACGSTEEARLNDAVRDNKIRCAVLALMQEEKEIVE